MQLAQLSWVYMGGSPTSVDCNSHYAGFQQSCSGIILVPSQSQGLSIRVNATLTSYQIKVHMMHACFAK